MPLNMDKSLSSWECLNTALRECVVTDTGRMYTLLKLEEWGLNRTSYKVRIAGRINKLKSQQLTARVKGEE